MWPATGAITGRVMNAAGDGFLERVRVTVEGTTLQAFTNEFGEYRLSDVPAGAATVRVQEVLEASSCTVP